jgi:hypothetical protein
VGHHPPILSSRLKRSGFCPSTSTHAKVGHHPPILSSRLKRTGFCPSTSTHAKVGHHPPILSSRLKRTGFCPSTSTHAKVGHRPPILSSRLKRSVGEGPAVSLSDITYCAVGESPPGSVSPSTANCRSLPYAAPNFLSRLVALANFVRLSLLKAACVALGGVAI